MPLARTHNKLYNELVVATSLKLDDTDGSNYLTLDWNEDDSSDRTLNLKVNSGNRTLDLAGDFQITAGVKITVGTPSNGQALIYNSTNSDWRPGNVSDEKVGIDSGATAGYLGAASNDGVLRTSSPLSYTDGGNFVTIAIDSTANLAISGIDVNNAGATGEIGVDFNSISSTFSTIAQSDAEGIASSSDLRIGLDETLRTLIICDRGDIATDFGLAASAQPEIVLYDATGTAPLKINATGISQIYGNTSNKIVFNGGQLLMAALNGLDIYTYADIASGHAYKFYSQPNCELTSSSAEQAYVYFGPLINQTSTANYVGFLMDVTETAAVGTSDYLLDLRVATATKIRVLTDGTLDLSGQTITTVNASGSVDLTTWCDSFNGADGSDDEDPKYAFLLKVAGTTYYVPAFTAV